MNHSEQSFISEDAPYAGLAQRYLKFLLDSERREAAELILNAVESNDDVRDMYLYVFQPAQHQIGYLWQTNQISVAQEHFCTAATQLVMSQLYPYIFNTEKIGKRLVATCVGGELHEIGVRMVSDFFEMDGWDTYYLGANTPANSILQTIEMRSADLLAVSASMTFNIGSVQELIADIKSSDVAKNIIIMVGGRPFNVSPGLWKTVMADCYAKDAQDAINTAHTLVPDKH